MECKSEMTLYGKCIETHLNEKQVVRNCCQKEFQQLKTCFQKAMQKAAAK